MSFRCDCGHRFELSSQEKLRLSGKRFSCPECGYSRRLPLFLVAEESPLNKPPIRVLVRARARRIAKHTVAALKSIRKGIASAAFLLIEGIIFLALLPFIFVLGLLTIKIAILLLIISVPISLMMIAAGIAGVNNKGSDRDWSD